MNTTKNESGKILESALVVAGFAMLGITGTYLYNYAEKHHSKSKENAPIHANEAKKVLTNKVATQMIILNGSKQNTK